MHEVFSSLLEGRDENRYKCKSNTRVVKRACFRSWSLPMAFFTMGQVCLIHHHFLRGPSSTRSSGHRRSLLWIHQLLKNCPGGSQIAMTMGNHGKPWFHATDPADLITYGSASASSCSTGWVPLNRCSENGNLTKQHDCDSCGLCQAPKSEEAQGGIFLDTITLLSWLQMTRHCKKSESR